MKRAKYFFRMGFAWLFAPFVAAFISAIEFTFIFRDRIEHCRRKAKGEDDFIL